MTNSNDPHGAQEDAGTALCQAAAEAAGKTADQADNCEDGEHRCPACPWRLTPAQRVAIEHQEDASEWHIYVVQQAEQLRLGHPTPIYTIDVIHSQENRALAYAGARLLAGVDEPPAWSRAAHSNQTNP